MSLLELVIRVFSTILVLLIMARLDGPRQISQMNFYDYVVGIAVGSIAGSACISDDVPLLNCLIAVVLFLLAGIFMSWLARKSMVLRRFLSGEPIILIAHGELQWNGLNRANMNVNELQSKLRHSGYFDIGQVDCAVMEPTGELSVQPKGFARPPKASDLNLSTMDPSLLANVVIDGSILYGNLSAFGKDEPWLLETLKGQGAQDIREVGLATLNNEGTLSVYLKNHDSSSHVSFI